MDYKSVLAGAWANITGDLPGIAKQAAVPLALIGVSGVLSAIGSAEEEPSTVLAASAGILTLVGQTVLILMAYRGYLLSAGEVPPPASQLFLRYVGVSVLGGLIAAVGMLLYVVPGIIAAILCSLAVAHLVRDDSNVIDSLKSSFHTVVKHIGTVLAVYLIVILGGAAATLAIIAVSMLAVYPPLAGAISAVLSALLMAAMASFTLQIVVQAHPRQDDLSGGAGEEAGEEDQAGDLLT